MKITDISLFKIRGGRMEPTFPSGDRQARPLDIYPEFNRPTGKKKHSEGVQSMHAIYVEIETDEGISGLFGPIQKPRHLLSGNPSAPF